MSGRRSRSLGDEERALWDIVTKSIAPLRKRKAAKAVAEAVTAPDVEPTAAKPKGRAPKVTVPMPAPPPSPPPLARLDRRLKQKLSRGTEQIDARIDLHGMTQSEAHHALARFLRGAQRDGARVVLVITGKGARSDDPFGERGVLKRA